METTEKHIAVGEWVKVIESRLKGYTGFVLKYDLIDDEYKVKITQDNLGKTVSGIARIDSDCLLECENFKDEDDLYALIDLALDLKDKKWFEELIAQLPQPLPF